MEDDEAEVGYDEYHEIVEGVLVKCDRLLIELDRYIKDLHKEPLSPTLDQLNPMKKWNEKRHDDRMQARHEELVGGVAETEVKLRDLIATGTTKKETLRKQVSDLKGELIDYSGRLKACKTTFVEDEENVRGVINLITIETAEIKNMVAFNREVIKQVEAANFFGSWGDNGGPRMNGRGRNNRSRKFNDRQSPRMAAEDNDEHHKVYLDRLEELRGCRDYLVSQLSSLLEKKESLHSSELELCENLENIRLFDGVSSQKKDVDALLKEAFENHKSRAEREDNEVSKAEDASDTILEGVSVANTMASSCCEDLRQLKSDIMEANTRLRHLVETREKMRETTSWYNSCNGSFDSSPEISISGGHATGESV